MSSRPTSKPEGTTPEGTTESPQVPYSEAARALAHALEQLQSRGAPTTEDFTGAVASMTEHTVTLKATRDAHAEAQAMLAEVTETRKKASEEAERILVEARDSAERARQELAGWATAQRANVEAIVADLIRSANDDADTIRAEALRTSMAEAEEVARQHLAEAAARARTDAERIRGEARQVLERTIELGEEATEALKEMTSSTSDLMTRLQGTCTAMAGLLADNPAPEPTDVEASGVITAADATHAPDDESFDDGADPDEDAKDAPATDADADHLLSDHDDADPDEADHEEDDHDWSDPSDGDAIDEQGEPPADRQLGSMFRRHAPRGR